MPPRREPLRARPLMRPSVLIYLYRRRLRVHLVAELLAALGVAIAVALIFAVIVANGSIAGSASQAIHTITGPASLQLQARGPEGFDEDLLTRVERLAGVKQAAPALEQPATIVGPGGRSVMVEVVGTDLALGVLDGLAHTLPLAALSEGLALTSADANTIGVASNGRTGATREVLVKLRGRAYRQQVSALLGPRAVGALSNARAAIMPLALMQRLAGLPKRISRILVQSEPGREAAVRAELQRLAAGRVTVSAADNELALLHEELGPSDQASKAFAGIAVLLGFLLAFNAMLLTAPERRSAIADLRLEGARRSAIVQMVLFEAFCLGLVACSIGVLGGYLLAVGALRQSSPGYLALAFTLGTSTVVGVQPLLISVVGGMLAICLASLLPLLDLRRGGAPSVHVQAGISGDALSGRTQPWLAAGAVALAALATVIFILSPALALPTAMLIAMTCVLLVPLVFAGTLRAAEAVARRCQRLTVLPTAATSLRATTLASVALISTGAVAVFGGVVAGGARGDLLRGLENVGQSNAASGEIWLQNPGFVLGISSFLPDDYSSRIARVPGVVSVHSLQGGEMDIGDRRALVLARPQDSDRNLLASQLVAGDLATALKRLPEGGWIVASAQIAQEQGAGLGGSLRLPTPTGTVRFRLAATMTNLGWAGGVVLVSPGDYSRLWSTHAPSALAVDLAPGVNASSARRGVIAALGPESGLDVLTGRGLARLYDSLSEEGLTRISEISAVLVIAAILAMGAALISAVWQRRASLAGARLEGAKPRQLRQILLVETALMLLAGCVAGAVTGIYGQLLFDRYLEHVTGFQVVRLAASLRPLEVIGVVSAAVLLTAIVPGWIASRVSPELALAEQ